VSKWLIAKIRARHNDPVSVRICSGTNQSIA